MADPTPGASASRKPSRLDSLTNRVSSQPFTSSQSCQGDSHRRHSRKWRPSWLSGGERSTTELDRRMSVSTTSSSTLSASTISSSGSSSRCNTYQLPGSRSDIHDEDKDGAVDQIFDTTNDATMALAALAESGLEDDFQPTKGKTRDNASKPALGIPMHLRSQSRASSTFSQRSAKPRDSPSESAEIAMVSKEYHGYWRAPSTSNLPPAAAICGAMLLTARLPSPQSDDLDVALDEKLKAHAHLLCSKLEIAEDPGEALGILRANSLECVVVALKSSLNTAKILEVPEKVSWACYQKIAQAKTRPDKVPDLWSSVAKLLKDVPQETMVIILFLLPIARRLQSRGLSFEGQPPLLFLLRGFWPRYLGDDVSKLLLTHHDEIPRDLPLSVESINYRFSGRRCNLLALTSSRPESPKRGVREIRTSEEGHVEW